MGRHVLFVVAAVAAVTVLGTNALPLQADTFVVNSALDDVDANLADGVCSTAGGSCTLRAAIQQANALPGPHVINVPAGVFYLTRFGPPEDNALAGDLDIRVEVTIVGAGMDVTVVDGLGADRVFDVPPGPPPGIQLNVADMTIRNGDAGPLGGGGINHPGTGGLSVARVRFADDHSGAGGAICHAGAAPRSIVDCVFEDNGAAGAGGAVYINAAPGSATNVSGSTFTSNISTVPGGAIYQIGAGSLTIDRCVFRNCHATGNAGAVAALLNGPLVVSNSEFEANTTTGGGGAILAAGGPAVHTTFTNDRFVSNSAGASGGACQVTAGGNLTVSGCQIADNIAISSGGGIQYASGGSLVVENSDFTANVSQTASGGGLFVSAGGTLALTNVSVADNHANGDGGGVYIAARSQATIVGSSFTGNSAASGSGGGVVDAAGVGALAISDCSFLQNTVGAGGSGGGLQATAAGNVTIWNSTFSGNEATGPGGRGGGFFSSAGPTALTNCTLSGNMASGHGGAIYNGPPLAITNCTLAGNGAFLSGAAIYNLGPLMVTLRNTIVTSSVVGPNCGGFPGTFISGGHNIDNGATCLPIPMGGDLPNTIIQLGPLQNNGGGRLTHAPLAGSPAIDGGAAAACPGTDERGVGRPLDGNGDGVAVCDIGAFENSDCNLNGQDDGTDISQGGRRDCNGNGVPDDCDIARGVLADADGDGIADICDTCTDTDGDGFGDPGFPANTCPLDNCPTTANPDQADSNNDGTGNACTGSPAGATAPCGACGLGIGMMMPVTLLGLCWMKRRGRRS
jgi:large repetitive protein